ncbi:MAG: metallophosphoesterase family protein [Pirellulales bacterium]
MSTGRLIAVGDVHGCVHALDAVLAAIAPTAADQFVFLGDLVDQGRDSRDVLDRLIALAQQCRVITIQGNHEEMMLAARHNQEALRYWEVCGGFATLNSYRYGARIDEVPEEHWQFLASCRPYYETDDVIFTHANYIAELPMAEQPDHQLRWALFEPDEMRPHVSGKKVFVGHTEQPDSEVRDLGFVACIDTACWRHGWLTAIEVHDGEIWQASRFGMLRERHEPSQRGRLPLLTPASA